MATIKCDSCKHGYKEIVYILGCGECSVNCCRTSAHVSFDGAKEICESWEPATGTDNYMDGEKKC